MSGWLWKKPEPQPNSFEEMMQNQAGDDSVGVSGVPQLGNVGNMPAGVTVPPSFDIKQEKPKEMKYSGFDPTALERGAKAIRELDKSKHVREALELTMKQEETKKKEAELQLKNIELQMKQEDGNRIRIAEEERRKTLKEQQKFNQSNEQYKDRLARKRHDDQLSQDRSNNEEILRRQEESVQKQELMRRETVEYQEKLRHENEMKRVTAEIAGKAKMERENHDLIKEKIKLEQGERRETILKTVSTAGNMIGSGIDTLLSNRDKMAALGLAVFGVAAGIYSAKHGIMTAARYVEARLGKPTLVRETSRLTLKELLQHPITTLAKMFMQRSDPLDGVVANKNLSGRLKVLAASTHFTKQNGGTYRNLLMYGPPGTGKTLFAKKLATSSGMDYAILTGGDIAPMGKEGVTAIHKVFDWSSTSRKGLLLFVDEADAFLRKRTENQMSEDMRSTLNAFLYRTGESSKNFMLVMASNRPDHLDWAINDRLDEMVEFALPGVDEREDMLHLYYKKYIADLVDTGEIKTEEFDVDGALKTIALQLEGFSGREISKLGIALQASVYASPDKTFQERMLYERVAESYAANKQKAVWTKEENIDGLIGT